MPAPPRMSQPPRWRAVLAGVATVCGVLWLGYAVESIRGRRAWAEVVREAEARGEPLQLAQLLPAVPPEPENFASVLAPVWVGEVPPPWRLAGDKEVRPPPDFGLWWQGETVPLDAWRSYLGTEDIVGWIDGRHAGELAELAEASRRSRAYFAVDHARGVFHGMAFLPPLRSLTRLFALRAAARLERGEGAEALADVTVALRLAGMVRDEPFLLTQLAANAHLQYALQAVRAGLARRVWTEVELAVLSEELGRLDNLGNGMRALRGDLAFSAMLLRGLADDSEQTVAMLTGGGHGPEFVHHVPSGWVYQNMTRLGRIYLDGIFPAYDAQARRVDLARLAAVDREVAGLRAGPYTILARMFMPPVHRAIANCASMQTQVDLARLACALEAYRLRRGVYPAALQELSGEVAGLRDLVTGEPPRYRRDEARGFLLYTTGANLRDDGGEVAVTTRGDLNPMDGDWVWPREASPTGLEVAGGG